MTPFIDRSLESDLHAAIAVNEEPRHLLERFASLTRESGMPDERAAGEYIADRLRALGIPVTVHDPELYLSIPGPSELRVGTETIRSRPPAFARPTGDVPVTGELFYVPSKYAGGTMDLFDTPSAAASGGGDDPVRGRIVVTEGYSMPGTVQAFERRGAIGQIFMHPGEAIHEGICTPIWGTPTHETLPNKPRTPVVCVNSPDGRRLAAMAARGGVTASIRTSLNEGWAHCLLPVAEIRGTEDADEFLLVHGHYDSWYVGIGDNATGDATLLELARVLHASRGRLKRSIRIAWWPGHSTGRYGGSTWYADTFADEIDQWCVGHLNIDSPGCVGATKYEEVMWMAEAGGLCRDAIRDAVGEVSTGVRPLRAGDYSFNQIGPTAFYMLSSNIPLEERKRRGYYAVGGNGGSPTWHTPADLPAVADLSIMERDLRVFLTTIARVVNAALYPYDYCLAIDEIAAAVRQYADAAGPSVGLDVIAGDLQRLRSAYEQWREDAGRRVASGGEGDRRAANATLRRLARILIPLNYARGERFDHDPALKFGTVPRLEAAMRLASASAEMRPFIRTALVRERNKIRAMLRAALREVGIEAPAEAAAVR